MLRCPLCGHGSVDTLDTRINSRIRVSTDPARPADAGQCACDSNLKILWNFVADFFPFSPVRAPPRSLCLCVTISVHQCPSVVPLNMSFKKNNRCVMKTEQLLGRMMAFKPVTEEIERSMPWLISWPVISVPVACACVLKIREAQNLYAARARPYSGSAHECAS